MKLNYFKEENEWRLLPDRLINNDDLDFRSSNSTIIPYHSLKFDLSSISQIMVVPSPNQGLASEAAFNLAYKYKLEEVLKDNEIKLSQVPYRSL